MKKISIIQIGALHDHAHSAIRCFRRMTDEFDLIGYAVPEGEKVGFPEYFEGVPCMTVEEALNYPGLDAVAIETGEFNLTKYALMAAKKGIHVFMDKPGGADLEEFEELVRVVKEKELIFFTGYMYRYNPAVQKVIKDAKAGKYGDIYCVEGQMNCVQSPMRREWIGTFPSGMMFYLGCHMVDLIYAIMGKPQEVIPFNSATGANNVNATDYGMAILKYKNGVSFAKSCAKEPGGFMRRQVVVCGSKGTVQLLPIEVLVPGEKEDKVYTTVREVTNEYMPWPNNGDVYDTEPVYRYDTMFQSFASYVRGEKINPYSPDYELEVYKTVLKCCGK